MRAEGCCTSEGKGCWGYGLGRRRPPAQQLGRPRTCSWPPPSHPHPHPWRFFVTFRRMTAAAWQPPLQLSDGPGPGSCPHWPVCLVLFQNGEVECSFTPCPELDCPREEWWLGPGQCCFTCREPTPMTGEGPQPCTPGRCPPAQGDALQEGG